MSATVSLAPLYQFRGWVVKKISVKSSGYKVWVHLRPDRRRKGFRCPPLPQDLTGGARNMISHLAKEPYFSSSSSSKRITISFALPL